MDGPWLIRGKIAKNANKMHSDAAVHLARLANVPFQRVFERSGEIIGWLAHLSRGFPMICF